MKSCIIRLALLVGLLFDVAEPAFSQSRQFTLNKFTTKDGLPDNYILNIFQDSRGFLWIGTTNGISRFDGKHFRNYNLQNNLPSLFAYIQFEDDQQRLWGATRRGIVQLQRDQFLVFPHDDSVTLDYVYVVNNIKDLGLVATTSHGAYRFEKDHWEKLKLYPGFENKQCSEILMTNDGMYINYGDHLVKKENTGEYKLLGKKDGLEGPYFRSIDIYDDTLHLVTEDGLFKVVNDKLIPLFERSLRGKIARNYFKDSHDRYWVCTIEDGLLYSAPGNTEEFEGHVSVTQNLISGFLEDKNHNIWVACVDGLGKIDEQPFVKYINPQLEEVQYVLKIPVNGNFVVHSRPNGFLYFDQKNFKPATFSLPQLPGYDRTKDIVDYHCVDDRERIWVTTRFRKLFCLTNESIKDFTWLVGDCLTLMDPDYNLKRRRFSIATDTFKIGNERSLVPFQSKNTKQYLLHAVMNQSFSNGMQIVTTQYDGAYLIDTMDNLIPVHEQLGIQKFMYSLRFLEEAGGKFWIYNNGEGLSRYHWNEELRPVKEFTINTDDGLPNNIVTSLCLDKKNRLWVTTLSGLILIEPDTSSLKQHLIRNLGKIYHIVYDRFAHAKLMESNDRSIWLSNYSEIYRFNPDDFSKPGSAPGICIEKIDVFTSTGKQVEKPLLREFWLSPSSAEFPYRENNIRIHYTGIDMQNYEGLQFSYRLEGLDSNWSLASANTSITFAKLSPGDYSFSVKARNMDGDWSDPVSFSFSVRTPFWLSWWFRILVVLVFSGILIYVFRSRFRQIQKKTRMENQMRELEMKALKAQMNPHFIYNALNSIQSLILNGRGQEAGSYISKFAKLLRQVLENAEKNLVNLDRELYSLQLYVDLEKLRLSMDIEFEEQVSEGVSTSTIQVPPLILQPFVENALWHGFNGKTGPKKIALQISEDDKWVICTITDNGIGRKKAEENYTRFPEGHLSKATHITKKRLIEFNESSEPEPITIEDLETNGSPSGTRVTIRIRKF